MEQHRSTGDAVDAVADDPASERLACVRANLVRAPGQRLKLDQSGPIANRETAPVTASVFV